MTPKIGYLLPTREHVMRGHPEAAPLIALAERAEALGYDSVWVGDSLLARPRHEPLILLAAVAGRTERVSLGTAVLLPALRNPFVLAQSAHLGRLARESASDPGERVRVLYRQVLLREPDPEELYRARELVEETTRELGDEIPAWESLGQALLATNEFRYVD